MAPADRPTQHVPQSPIPDASFSMTLAPQITFRHLEPSPAMEGRIRALVARLERFSPSILRCRVTVQAPPAHHRQGRVFEIGVDVDVPDRQICVRHSHPYSQAHEDAYVALRDAFRAVRRQLQDYERRHRGDVKAHAPRAQAQAQAHPDEFDAGPDLRKG